MGIDYGGIAVTPWTSTSFMKMQMYIDGGSNLQYNNFFFDLPSLHIESNAGLRFITAMTDENIDVSLFSFKSI